MRCGSIKLLLLLVVSFVTHISYAQITEKDVMRAIKAGDLEVVLQFLNEGNDINGIYGKEKSTLLNYSIKTESFTSNCSYSII